MNSPKISVLVLTYHPQKEALFATLKSAVWQQDCDFELIVCDDGSPDFFEADIRAFLDGCGCPYQILAHKENQGTVKNILDGVSAARGQYVKPISPGDLFYDEYTLRDTVSFMEKHGAKAAFGGLLYYSCDGELQVKNVANPCLSHLYRADRPYSHRRAAKHQTVYNDFLCGAAGIYEKEAFFQALQTISPAVRFAEDIVFQLFAAKGVRIYKIDRHIVWYEYGSGISTQKKPGFTRVEEDFYRFYPYFSELFPKDPYPRRAIRSWEARKNGSEKQNLLLKLLPDRLLFSLRARLQKRKMTIAPYSAEFFHRCYR